MAFFNSKKKNNKSNLITKTTNVTNEVKRNILNKSFNKFDNRKKINPFFNADDIDSDEKPTFRILCLLNRGIEGNRTIQKLMKLAVKEAADSIGKSVDANIIVDFKDPVSDFITYTADTNKGYDRLYLKNEGGEYKRIPKNYYIACIVRATKKGTVSFVRFLRHNLDMYVSASDRGIEIVSDKLNCQTTLSKYTRVVPTISYNGDIHSLPKALELLDGYTKDGKIKVIVKYARGSQGNGVSRYHDMISLQSSLPMLKDNVLLQKFILTGKTIKDFFDIRIIWAKGFGLICAMKRTPPDGDFRANLSQGGEGEDYTDQVTDEIIEMCEIVEKHTHLDTFGVDIIIDYKTKKPYILENNSNPGIKVIHYTKKNFFEEIVLMCLANAKDVPIREDDIINKSQRLISAKKRRAELKASIAKMKANNPHIS